MQERHLHPKNQGADTPRSPSVLPNPDRFTNHQSTKEKFLKRTKTLYQTLALTTVACLLCFAIAQAKKPDKPPGGGGDDETGSAYSLTDLFGFPDNGYQSRGMFLTGRDGDGNVLIYITNDQFL